MRSWRVRTVGVVQLIQSSSTWGEPPYTDELAVAHGIENTPCGDFPDPISAMMLLTRSLLNRRILIQTLE